MLKGVKSVKAAKKSRWSSSEDAFIKKHAGHKTVAWIAEQLSRTENSVRSRANNKLKLSLWFVVKDECLDTEKCGKLIKPAKNGVSRGVCTRTLRHHGFHKNIEHPTCHDCGTELIAGVAAPSFIRRGSGQCTKCSTMRGFYWHRANGVLPKKFQKTGELFVFPCGCSSVLPERGKSNKRVSWSPSNGQGTWACRISSILRDSRTKARHHYAPIDPNTPHELIWMLMDEEACWRCKQPLEWVIKHGTTPHLHHNHGTGAIYGFTHARCNPHALEHEMDELRNHIAGLEMPLAKAA